MQKVRLSYGDLYAPYFSYGYVYNGQINSIILSTRNDNGTLAYYIMIFYQLDSTTLRHIQKMDIGTLSLVEIKYRSIEEAKTVFDMLNADRYVEYWWNTEECYYDYDERKDPDGAQYAYCIVDPSRGKDQLRIKYLVD